MKGSPSLALSGDITNGVKHLKRDEGRARIHPGAHVSAIGRFQPGALQLAGIVVMGDRETSDAMQLADNCIQEWTSFLQSKGLA